MGRRGVALAVLGALLVAAPARADTALFDTPGTETAFTVPAGVHALEFVAIGGRGGDATTAVGGLGALVEGELEVIPGQTLYMVIGGDGEDIGEGGEGGFNGGGDGAAGGGGATDIRNAPIAAGLTPDTRLVVAAGGGGGGADGSSMPQSGGSGGDAGEAGAAVGLYSGGAAGTPSEGGEGGEGCETPAGDGGAGVLGAGGAGGDSDSGTTGPGGGGGGGLYGGGGGGGACNTGSSGGGGGSSLLPPDALTTSAPSTASPMIELNFEPESQPPVGPPAPATPTVTPPSPVPNTILGARPGRTVTTRARKVKVRFGFSSDVAGARFECKLDKRGFVPCRSPRAYDVRPGKHNFSVRAVGPGGTDPSPAKLRFRIRKTK